MSTKPRIVVLGAGYAGLRATKQLSKLFSQNEAEIVLVNKHNYHYETTWLHEVAAGTVNHNHARVMLRDVINQDRVHLVFDEVVNVKKDDNQVELQNSTIDYDYLVMALGFETNTFGITGMEDNAFYIQDIDSSQLIREHIEYQFVKYKNAEYKNEDDLTILVGGAGFTGIEFIGELVEKVPELCRKYDIDRHKARIINVEAMPSILPMFDEELVSYAKASLERRGIEFRLGTKIQECKPDSFIVNDGEEIKAGTIIWTGGVKASPIMETSDFKITKGRVTVNSDLRAPEKENIFIIGDCAWVMDPTTGKPFPPTGQAAMQHAETCARNIKSLVNGETLETFDFDDKGTVASLGITDGIGQVYGKNLQGKPAAAMKKVVDDRSLYLLGGPLHVLKKGKFRPF